MTHVPVETTLTPVSHFPPNRASLVTSSITCSVLIMRSPLAFGPSVGSPMTTTPSLRLLTEIVEMSLRGNCSFTLKLLVSRKKQFCGLCVCVCVCVCGCVCVWVCVCVGGSVWCVCGMSRCVGGVCVEGVSGCLVKMNYLPCQ